VTSVRSGRRRAGRIGPTKDGTLEGDTSAWKPRASRVLETADGGVVISHENGAQMSKTLDAIDRPQWM
jgi:hypothetical protein